MSKSQFNPKGLIPCQRVNSTQKVKLSGEVSEYDLYYSLIVDIKGNRVEHAPIIKELEPTIMPPIQQE